MAKLLKEKKSPTAVVEELYLAAYGRFLTAAEAKRTTSDFDGATTLRFDHPGLTAAHAKDHRFKVTVPADMPSGTYDVRAAGKYGVSSPRLFAVSRGPVEAVKKPGNSTPDAALPVTVNTVVSGATDANREDFYLFPTKKGQRVVIDCRALAIDSALDATLALTAANGRPHAANGDYRGRDPLLDFVAPANGDYLIAVADLTFRGGLPYRLMATDWTRSDPGW